MPFTVLAFVFYFLFLFSSFLLPCIHFFYCHITQSPETYLVHYLEVHVFTTFIKSSTNHNSHILTTFVPLFQLCSCPRMTLYSPTNNLILITWQSYHDCLPPFLFLCIFVVPFLPRLIGISFVVTCNYVIRVNYNIGLPDKLISWPLKEHSLKEERQLQLKNKNNKS